MSGRPFHRRARRGFGLMEVVFAVAIVSTALLALQATVSGGIKSAGNSINRRAAREVARAKLEEILAGIEQPESISGELEERPGFMIDAQVEELMVGVAEAQTETIRVVVVKLTYPITATGGAQTDEFGQGGDVGEESETESITLASVQPVLGPPGGGSQPQ